MAGRVSGASAARLSRIVAWHSLRARGFRTDNLVPGGGGNAGIACQRICQRRLRRTADRSKAGKQGQKGEEMPGHDLQQIGNRAAFRPPAFPRIYCNASPA